jgi:protein-disulfide isomerase
VTQDPETQESPQVEEPQEAANKTPSPSPSKGTGLPPLAMQFIVGIAAAVIVVAGAAGLNHAWPLFGSGSSGGGKTQVTAALPTPAADPTPSFETEDAFNAQKALDVSAAGAPSKGPSDAKVTIIEFSDFECPYCDRFVTQTLPSILKDYGDKVQFVFRDYPLPATMHPYAEQAAEAGQCANDQGAFWQFHDLMFQNQTALAGMVQADATNGVTQVVAQMKTYAASLNLNTATFNSCLDSGADKAKVAADQKAMTDALTQAGISSFGTPSFFINGKFVSGAYPYDSTVSGYADGMFTFKQAIEDSLAAAQ